MRKSILLISILSVFLFLGAISAYGENGPLYVAYYEKYNITGNTLGDGTVNSTINNLTGYIIINNTGTTINDTLSDVWVAVNISNNITAPAVQVNNTPKPVFIESSAPTYTNLPQANTYIHIPVLPNNSYVIINFSIDKSITGIPIIVSEAYSTNKIPSRKPSNWVVYINISRNISALPSTDTPVSISMAKYLSNDSNYYGSNTWNLLNITGYIANQGNIITYDGPYFTGNANDTLNWTNVILNTTQNATISINITGNNTYANRTATLEKYGFAVIFFEFNGTVSGTKVEGVYATGYCGASATKEGPFLNASSGKYDIWQTSANVSNTASEYYFNLTNVSIKAYNGTQYIQVLDPSSLSPIYNYSTALNQIIAPGESWQSPKLNFTFDGVPVIWAGGIFKVADQNITLINRSVQEVSTKYGSSYIIVEEIYVVGSYLIKVTKHIIPNADG
ncbi:hypothetical protein, partial [Methanocaldococcus sp.]